MESIYGFVASGGGAKGAWGGGVAQYLIEELGRDYKYLSGTSTGALLMVLAAAGDMPLAKEAYTSVTNDDIYTLCPYRVKKSKNGNFTTRMAYVKIGWNLLIRKQKTFGDSTKLRVDTIPKFITNDKFEKIKGEEKEMIAAVTNLTLGTCDLKSSLEYNYEDFMDWVYASTCAAPFMSIFKKDMFEYVDGGFLKHAPIQALIDRGCDEIDFINHRQPDIDVEIVRNSLHGINRIIDVMMWNSATNNLQMSELKAKDKDVVINVYEPGRKLTNNELVFDKDMMEKWWDEGFAHAKNTNEPSEVEKKSYLICKGKKPKRIK
jgi:NTE family protein